MHFQNKNANRKQDMAIKNIKDDIILKKEMLLQEQQSLIKRKEAIIQAASKFHDGLMGIVQFGTKDER